MVRSIRRWRTTVILGALFFVCFRISENYFNVDELHSNSKDDSFTEVHKSRNVRMQPPLEFQAEPPESMEAVYKEGKVGNFEPAPERVVEGPGATQTSRDDARPSTSSAVPISGGTTSTNQPTPSTSSGQVARAGNSRASGAPSCSRIAASDGCTTCRTCHRRFEDRLSLYRHQMIEGHRVLPSQSGGSMDTDAVGSELQPRPWGEGPAPWVEESTGEVTEPGLQEAYDLDAPYILARDQPGEVFSTFNLPVSNNFSIGEMGKPVKTTTPDKESLMHYGCDIKVSDQISLDRTIPDTRQEECKFWHYPSNLPSASVIVIFHNEGNSTLLRTIHSIINRSPPSLLKELVLIDDASTRGHLLAPLDNYIQRFNGLVKLYRNKKRLGAMGSRTRGAREAISEILVILEPHCEVNVNWLPPLIQRIALDRTAMAQPTVDAVHYQDFTYIPIMMTMVKGIFDWGLRYKEQAATAKEQAQKWKHHSEPYGTPTHAGGLFAVARKHFFDIGGYDEGLQIWGAEGFQLSFKQWMCGGKFEMVPCSRVGHIYHYTMPFTFKVSYLEHNNVRTAEGWMDEYKEYLYVEYPALRTMKVNVTDQLELRKRLGCKSFKWFMENVAYDVVKDYPLPPANVVWGSIKERHGRECLRKIDKELKLGACDKYGEYFRYNTAGQMSVGEYCLVFKQEKFSFPMCPDGHKHPWEWNQETGLIRHPVLNKCIQSDQRLILVECNNTVHKQQWDLEKRN